MDKASDIGDKYMKNTVTDNVRRATAKAMYDEILQLIDSWEGETFSPEEIVALLNRFMANPPAEKVEKKLTMMPSVWKIKSGSGVLATSRVETENCFCGMCWTATESTISNYSRSIPPFVPFFRMSVIIGKKVGVTIPIIHL